MDVSVECAIEHDPGLRFLGVVKPGAGGIGGIVVALASIVVLGVRVANVLAAAGGGGSTL